ncbi:MAG: undecaprenyl-diphosphate phosphatase [Spirochaetia bacterium]|nr:undecaprenyl-diphosphate phosphatase [Spirochaetia bacterium]
MTVFQSIILGLIQGIAEFLPISSSGHLQVVQKLFKLDEVPLLYDIILHVATLLAVCIFFRKKIANLFCVLYRWIFKKPEPNSIDETDFISGTDERGRKAIIAVLISTLVTGVIGIFTKKLIDNDQISIKITCAGFIVTALLLIFSSLLEKFSAKTMTQKKELRQQKGISALQAVIIGIMQGFGTLPGISRSGSTIAGAQLSGVKRETAGEFSFIISIPAILGAFVLELKDFLETKTEQTLNIIAVIAGSLSAFIFGYLALAFLMKIIKKGKLEFFACYLIPLGILGIIFL